MKIWSVYKLESQIVGGGFATRRPIFKKRYDITLLTKWTDLGFRIVKISRHDI